MIRSSENVNQQSQPLKPETSLDPIQSLVLEFLTFKFGAEKAEESLADIKKRGQVNPEYLQALIRFETQHVRTQKKMDKLISFELRLKNISDQETEKVPKPTELPSA